MISISLVFEALLLNSVSNINLLKKYGLLIVLVCLFAFNIYNINEVQAGIITSNWPKINFISHILLLTSYLLILLNSSVEKVGGLLFALPALYINHLLACSAIALYLIVRRSESVVEIVSSVILVIVTILSVHPGLVNVDPISIIKIMCLGLIFNANIKSFKSNETVTLESIGFITGITLLLMNSKYIENYLYLKLAVLGVGFIFLIFKRSVLWGLLSYVIMLILTVFHDKVHGLLLGPLLVILINLIEPKKVLNLDKLNDQKEFIQKLILILFNLSLLRFLYGLSSINEQCLIGASLPVLNYFLVSKSRMNKNTVSYNNILSIVALTIMITVWSIS